MAQFPVPARRIETLDDLRAHLQTAIEIEHATIPPYFTAWLSCNEEFNCEAAQVIRSVLLEEMLHLTLAANLLNAVDGHPHLTGQDFVPVYPHRLPHSGRRFEVSIERFSRRALEVFLEIEQPEPHGASPEPGGYHTIGQFYEAIARGIEYLCDQLGEQKVFSGPIERQVRPENYYGSGTLLLIRDRESALRAVREIKEQGEGAHHSVFDRDRVILGDGPGNEPAHYFRFAELLLGRRFSGGDTLRTGPRGSSIRVDFRAAYPIVANQRLSDYEPGSPIRCALGRFCDSYRELLISLEESFNGRPERLTEATARMFTLKSQALALMRTPAAPGAENTVGLVFTRAGQPLPP